MDQVHFSSYQEASARVFQHLRVDLWRVALEYQSCVQNWDCLQTQREAATESQELQVNLGELDVELPEVSNVIEEESLTEVKLNKLVFECFSCKFELFMGSQQVLKCIQTDFVLHDV